jgi:glycosyltransferase involved in cell wall biosynthesis
MRVSVIIPVKDDDRVFACVSSVLACAGEAESLQVLVVENGSSEAFQRSLAALPQEVDLLTVPQPGVYAARNRAIEKADGDAILFTDADCVVRPGWVRAAVDCLERGADIAQGFSGTTRQSLVDRMIQARYQAHLRRRRPGEATECDTRNLAVRREVFESLRFNERYRRVGDTEFGLLAERLGFRVAYSARMAADHAHEPDIPLFAAKQVCHGWGAQRLMYEHPEVRWHGGHLRLVAKWSGRLRRVPGGTWLGGALAQTSVAAGRLLQLLAPRLPFPVAVLLLGAIDKAAGLAGHLMFAPGEPEPSPSAILGRAARD